MSATITPSFTEPEARVDGTLKTTGAARYAADYTPPGTLWAKFLTSPLPHALIKSMDTRAAKAVPGVHAVLTGADIGPRRFGKILYDQPVLAYERVRFVGERVAAVAAETAEAAEAAVGLIAVPMSIAWALLCGNCWRWRPCSEPPTRHRRRI